MIRSLAVLLAFAWPMGAAAHDAGIGFGAGAFDRSAPVEVTADSLTTDRAEGVAVLTGNVVVVQGDLRLAAREVVVRYATGGEGSGRIERLEAEGDVVIVSGADAAEGEAAVYTLGSGEVVMTGDVVVTQGDATVAGDRVAVNLETGVGTVTGRVRTVLQP